MKSLMKNTPTRKNLYFDELIYSYYIKDFFKIIKYFHRARDGGAYIHTHARVYMYIYITKHCGLFSTENKSMIPKT